MTKPNGRCTRFVPVGCGFRAAAAGSQEGSGTGTESHAARAGVDEKHAGEWRGPHRVREARPPARFLLADVPRRQQPVRGRRKGAGRLADGGPSQRGHTKTRDGEALSNALQLLGTTINANVAGESGSDDLCVHGGEVRRDARRPRRHAAQLDVPGARARAAARSAARGADPGAGAARRDCRPHLSADVFGADPSVRPGRHGAVARRRSRATTSWRSTRRISSRAAR